LKLLLRHVLPQPADKGRFWRLAGLNQFRGEGIADQVVDNRPIETLDVVLCAVETPVAATNRGRIDEPVWGKRTEENETFMIGEIEYFGFGISTS
jgi:hypothetical protein